DRRELVLVLVMTLLGALAEVMTLGALLPFLALIADPQSAGKYPLVGWFAETIAPGRGLLALTILFSAAAVAAGALRIALAWATNRCVFGLGRLFAAKVYDRALHQNYRFHLMRNSGAVLATLQQVELIAMGVLMPFLQSI